MDVLICLGKKVSLLLLHLMHAQIGSQLALKCACQRLDQILVLPKYLTAGSRASWDMFMSSCTLFWDDSIKIWDENLLLFTFLTGKLSKNLFWTNKNQEVYLPNYHNKFSSKINVQKYRPDDDMKRFKDFKTRSLHLILGIKFWFRLMIIDYEEKDSRCYRFKLCILFLDTHIIFSNF